MTALSLLFRACRSPSNQVTRVITPINKVLLDLWLVYPSRGYLVITGLDGVGHVLPRGCTTRLLLNDTQGVLHRVKFRFCQDGFLYGEM
jgi:hypothetical protein